MKEEQSVVLKELIRRLVEEKELVPFGSIVEVGLSGAGHIADALWQARLELVAEVDGWRPTPTRLRHDEWRPVRLPRAAQRLATNPPTDPN